MVRDGLCLVLCACILFGASSPSSAGPAEDAETRFGHQLAVQAALQKGLDHLRRGEHAAAVTVLESKIALIDGNHNYLVALRDAYRGHIGELQRAKRLEEAKKYLARLAILDPSIGRDSTPAAPQPAALASGPDAASESIAVAPPPASTSTSTATASAPPPAPVPHPAAAPAAPPALAAAATAMAPLTTPPATSGTAATGSGSTSVAALASEGLPSRPIPEKPKPRVAVGKADDDSIKEDDPFAASNSVQGGRVNNLLDQAEREFAARRFEQAAKLYDQANRADAGSTSNSADRWAYCKLYLVAQQLNRPDAPAGAELEREVRSALMMAPKLDGFGKDLLGKIQERGSDAPRVEVRHTARQGTGWALAETANFRVFHTQSTETAERAARIAEATRLSMTRKWFGDANLANWTPRCDIYLYPTAADYARATGAPPGSPGHSTMSLDAGRVIVRKVDLRCDDPNMLTGVLPHETTHVVLAGRFGTHHVPRWADEGMAVLTEPQHRINLHLRNLPAHQRDGDLFPSSSLLQMDKYPEPRLIGPFYAQSVSMVDFLSRRKGPQTFSRFLREGLDHGYEAALQKHYDIRSFADLDRLWRDHAFGAGAMASTAEKRR